MGKSYKKTLAKEMKNPKFVEPYREAGDLESVLRDCFGCKKPFRKNPVYIGCELDGNKKYSNVTKAG